MVVVFCFCPTVAKIEKNRQKETSSFDDSSRFRRASLRSELLEPPRPPSIPQRKPRRSTLTLRSDLHAPQHILRARHIKKSIRAYADLNFKSSTRIKVLSICGVSVQWCLWQRSKRRGSRTRVTRRMEGEYAPSEEWAAYFASGYSWSLSFRDEPFDVGLPAS